jgi:hypothetical protein
MTEPRHGYPRRGIRVVLSEAAIDALGTIARVYRRDDREQAAWMLEEAIWNTVTDADEAVREDDATLTPLMAHVDPDRRWL